jgi:DNA-binding IclR family transcriptional regulator
MTTVQALTSGPAAPHGRPPLRLVEPGSPRARTARPRTPSRRSADEDLSGGVKSVVAALDVLDCFAETDELGVSDIARRLGVAKSTAHRLLTSLCARGLAERNPESGQYRLGLHLFELGQLTADRMRLRRAAMPLLEELRQASGCSTQLGIARGEDVFFVGRLETLSGMKLLAAAPRRFPAHRTATGKAIAAFDPAVARACRTAGLNPAGNAAVVSPTEFDRTLDEVRRRGVATSFDDAMAGVGSVAAPVLDSTGRAVAAVSLLRPTAELAGDLGRHAQLVSIAARRLARTLAI